MVQDCAIQLRCSFFETLEGINIVETVETHKEGHKYTVSTQNHTNSKNKNQMTIQNCTCKQRQQNVIKCIYVFMLCIC